MELKDRLIRSDIRHLENSLKAVSEDLIILQEFIQYEFASEFLAFLRSRDPKKANSTLSLPSTSAATDTAVNHSSHSQPKKQKLNESVPDKKISRRRRRPAKLGSEPEKENDPTNEGGSSLELDEEEVFALYPQTHYEDGGDYNVDDQENYEAEDNSKQDEHSNNSKEQDDNDNNDSVTKYSDEEDEEDNASDPDFEPSTKLQQGSSGSGNRKRKSAKSSSLTKNKMKKESLIVKIKEEKKYECPICDVSLASRVELKTHTSEHTEDEAIQSLVCQNCCVKFVNEQVYMSHMEKGHGDGNTGRGGDPKSRVCSYCSRSCASVQRRIEHERTHTGEKPFKCPHCEESFTRMDNQVRHMKRSH